MEWGKLSGCCPKFGGEGEKLSGRRRKLRGKPKKFGGYSIKYGANRAHGSAAAKKNLDQPKFAPAPTN